MRNMLVGAISHAFIAFLMFMSYARVRFHHAHTPIAEVKKIAFCIVFTYLIGVGLLSNTWDIAIFGMIGAFAGFGLGLYERGDVAYYQQARREWTEFTQNQLAPEDHPNWPDFKP